LQITQCFDRAGRGTRHVRHTFGWYSCEGWAGGVSGGAACGRRSAADGGAHRAVVGQPREAVEAGGGDGARVGERRHREDDDAEAHHPVRVDPVDRVDARVGQQRQHVVVEEREAARHQRDVEELQRRVGPPAADVLDVVERAPDARAEAAAEDRPQARAAG